MKKAITTVFSILALLGIYACDNSLDKVFDDDTFIEFQPAVITANSAGRSYPLISSGNSVTAGATITTQLNLVGRQRGTELTVRVTPDPNGTTAPASSYTLSNGGAVVFPPMSSTAALTVTVGRATSSTATLSNVVLVIDSTSTDYKASQNYKRVGYSIRR
ncbi:MAG: hypothetical protein H7Z72_24335 [Bacteroidetes bacterium]|nr:hypothetical protein [Fibrella sp.]